MRLTIVAATGGLGRELVEQALAAGHRVTAVVRDPETLSRGLTTLAARRIAHTPAPLALAGAWSERPAAWSTDASEYFLPVVGVVVTDFAAPDWGLLEASIEGADAVLSALGPRDSEEIRLAERGTHAIVRAMEGTGVRRIVVTAPPAPTLRSESRVSLGEPCAGLARLEDILGASDLDWTVVRLPQLTDVSRANVAHAMLRAVEQPKTIRQAIGIDDFQSLDPPIEGRFS